MSKNNYESTIIKMYKSVWSVTCKAVPVLN